MTHVNLTFTSEDRPLPSSSSTSIPISTHEPQNDSDFNHLTLSNENLARNSSFSTQMNHFELNLASFNITVLVKAFLYFAGLITGYILRHLARQIVDKLYRSCSIFMKKIKQRKNKIAQSQEDQDIKLSTLPTFQAPNHPSPPCPPLPLRPNKSRLCCCTINDKTENLYETLPAPSVLTSDGYDQPISSSNEQESQAIINLGHVSPYAVFSAASSVSTH